MASLEEIEEDGRAAASVEVPNSLLLAQLASWKRCSQSLGSDVENLLSSAAVASWAMLDMFKCRSLCLLNEVV